MLPKLVTPANTLRPLSASLGKARLRIELADTFRVLVDLRSTTQYLVSSMAGPCLQTSMQLQFLDTDFNWTSFLRVSLGSISQNLGPTTCRICQFPTDSHTRLPLIQALLAELVGTAVFIFFSTATVTSGCHTSGVASNSGNRGDTSPTTGTCLLPLLIRPSSSHLCELSDVCGTLPARAF